MPRQKTYCYFAVRIVGFVLALHTQCAWYRAKITWKRMDDSYFHAKWQQHWCSVSLPHFGIYSEDREPRFFTPTLSWHLSKWDVGVIFALLDSFLRGVGSVARHPLINAQIIIISILARPCHKVLKGSSLWKENGLLRVGGILLFLSSENSAQLMLSYTKYAQCLLTLRLKGSRLHSFISFTVTLLMERASKINLK